MKKQFLSIAILSLFALLQSNIHGFFSHARYRHFSALDAATGLGVNSTRNFSVLDADTRLGVKWTTLQNKTVNDSIIKKQIQQNTDHQNSIRTLSSKKLKLITRLGEKHALSLQEVAKLLRTIRYEESFCDHLNDMILMITLTIKSQSEPLKNKKLLIFMDNIIELYSPRLESLHKIPFLDCTNNNVALKKSSSIHKSAKYIITEQGTNNEINLTITCLYLLKK